jgi:hypothetical protein
VVQGGGQPHYHGDPFSDQTSYKCLYGIHTHHKHTTHAHTPNTHTLSPSLPLSLSLSLSLSHSLTHSHTHTQYVSTYSDMLYTQAPQTTHPPPLTPPSSASPTMATSFTVGIVVSVSPEDTYIVVLRTHV